MKKITLLFTLFLATSLMYGQVVLSEDFEAGTDIPATWTNNDIEGGGEVWAIGSGANAIGYSDFGYNYGIGGMAGNFATFDSDGYGGDIVENAALTSPYFDTTGLTTITLSFNHFFTAGYGGQGYVEVTTNGFAWAQVATFTGAAAADSSFGYEAIDVSTLLAGSTTAQVRFRWTGDYSWGWSFDNVSVFQCIASAPDAVAAAVSPIDTATDVEIIYEIDNNLVGPFEWTPAATGDVATSYSMNFGTDIAASNIGTVAELGNGNSVLYDWEPNTTYYWSIESSNCGGSTPGPVWSFTTAACTATAAPVAASAPVPADGAPSVDLSETPEGGLSFSWTAGSPDDVYTLNIGTENPPTQSFDWENGDMLTSLSVDETYYWSVDVVNCFGVTEGAIWSFTTGPLLSIEDNVLEAPLSVYPNPTSGILNIKSTQDIDTVTVFNLLGQNVASFTKNTIIDSSINLSELSNGLYLVKITSGDKTETLRVNKE